MFTFWEYLGTYTPSTFAKSRNISSFDLSLFSLQSLTTLRFTSSPSPITKKSKNSLYGSGFALTTGPPAKTIGLSLSFAFKGILYLSNILNISKKSKSKEKEKAINSTSAGLNSVVSVSEQTLSILTSSISSMVLNIQRKPNDDIEKE